MTNEEKQLLLKDLCARLPYGVIADCGWQIRVLDAEDYGFYSKCDNPVCKPYLRPMSSMTEEEKKIMRSYGFELIPYDTDYTGFANIANCIDEASFRFMEEFLNAHHLDYRGLIPMGLALEAPEGLYYKTE